ncbi:GNAT family N-acetyltransferase [Kineococcus rhizosphaerae]|uniref:Acetyltransferase (GNAT) family protein n=1 Tax=Kineococcus rhizosphaerae TaxID=559628 RepID=A0A2T0R6B0_9ACTN|nr:GNAT family N-acetyltransferase [Kineococcus rhizosphaerae]PRY16682.1 acetyltransferase (GNAT) family protein [Kineococcus rhizosphaerae]
MLHTRTRLSPDDLRAVAALEQEVVAHDGGRLKIEWNGLRDRTGDHTNDLLWTVDGQVVGYVGFDTWNGRVVELVGMVAPGARGRGIGSALLEAAVRVCRERGFAQALLIVPRPSAAGHHLAQRLGAPLEHSEHALRLDHAPATGEEDARTVLRDATAADLGVLTGLLTAAFGEAPTHLEDGLRTGRTLLVEHAGEPVGTVRLQRDGDQGGVYGFAVDPRAQGRGIGRDVLRRVCREFFAGGATSVRLEVAVDNDRALGLYTSVGFARVQTEDYYDLPLGG